MGEKMEPIQIRGLKQNNLKNISLDIPKNQIVVFTGVSGSGKSSILSSGYCFQGLENRL